MGLVSVPLKLLCVVELIVQRSIVVLFESVWVEWGLQAHLGVR